MCIVFGCHADGSTAAQHGAVLSVPLAGAAHFVPGDMLLHVDDSDQFHAFCTSLCMLCSPCAGYYAA
jgi:hypothetical protein